MGYDIGYLDMEGIRTAADWARQEGWNPGLNDAEAFAAELAAGSDFRTFFAQAPALNPARANIKGVVCGVRVEDIEEPTMREIRYLDKLIDELAKGKAMEKILRK